MADVTSLFENMRVLAHGEHSGSATAHQLPSQVCGFVNFVAKADNSGVVCVGRAGVTLTAGTDTTTAGFELAAKAQTGFLPCSNLNEFYIICTGTGDDVSYVCIG